MKLASTVLALIALFSSPLWAQTIPIVGDDNAKPKNWLSEDGTAMGIHIALLEEISNRTGFEFTDELVPWKRALVLSQAGKAAIIGFSKTKEREEHWHYSAPLFFDELVFVARKGHEFEYSGLESLVGRRVGIKSGATYGDDFEEAKRAGHLVAVETTDREDQLRMLVAGRVDLVLLSPGAIALETVIAENEWLREHKDDFKVLSPPYKLDPNYVGFPKTMDIPGALEMINDAIHNMNVDGTYAKIVSAETKTIIDELRSVLAR
ncbi:substrate-binding periplasmic protein [Roseibium sediminicola]|uniref:Transporter substrate-binding domain-containing protein n=1 Tax=Roseibium sediminicola TaxID=2933272 RepID=A0ABT0H545_9HYPH|nr:transporter substrate-binding domain-containing protein [Roseibium sp. CAU 1639]MCK7616195.1 transporter substrate-binding domain-containing protein [Roseibium sp. CAU 1639]